MDEDSMIDNVGSETVPLDGMEMNVEGPIVVLGNEDKARQLEESEEVGDEEDPEEEVNIEEHNEEDPEEEVKNDGNSKEEVNIEEHNVEDPEAEVKNNGNSKEEVNIEEHNEEEVKNDGNSKEEVNIDEHNEEDPEEEVRNDENRNEKLIIEEINEDDPEEEVSKDENPKEEVSIEENNEDHLEEEVRNDENRKEELIIEENYEDGSEEEVKNEEDATNNARSAGKIEAISKKMGKSRKKPKMLKNNIALRKNVKNALVSTSKLDEHQCVGKFDTEMITMPMLAKNNIPNDVGTVVVTSEQTDIVDDVDNGVLNMNAVVLGDEEKKEHEIGELNNEENTKEELQNEGGTRNEAKAKEKLEANSKKKANKKIGKKKKKYLRGKNEVVVNDGENPESSKKKTTTKDKCMGMIFMCNSKTKMDCYHYQVLGLPASKRDIVFEIYEGMKLFLFDFDLKLIYGIYEAAGPGGYNIEPKAFNSAFPSQVRFAVLEDCLPLAEEKLKKIIKDNYYSKNKFDCQLNSKQVENLCELFRVASKGSTYKQLNGSQNAEGPPFVDHGLKQPPRGRKAKGPRAEAPAFVERKSKWLRRRRKAESQQAEAPPFVDHGRKQPPGGRKAKGGQAKDPAFVERESKRPRRRRKVESQRAEAPIPVDHEPKQPRRSKKRKIPQAEAPIVLDRKPKRRRGSRKAEARPFVDPKPKRLRQSQGEETHNFLYRDSRHPAWEGERHRTLARDRLYPENPVAYRREVYDPPLEHPPPRKPLHLPLASSHIPLSERDVYRRDELHYHVVRPSGVDLRRQDEFNYRDDFNHGGSYLAYRAHSSYRYLSSSAAQPSEYYQLASGRPASTYHLSAAPPADFQSYHSGYQYYP